ncbi:hypothetical protein [Streptomyces sp. RLB3-17]|uniref:hypothetical protein n=1 Tax=Streptomyces sp. RLB3-17 TaxID=2594455 RepID=UPI0039A2D6CF
MRDEDQAEVLPGFTVHGMDVGKWLVKQRKSAVWQALTDATGQASSDVTRSCTRPSRPIACHALSCRPMFR